jgi:hypothetical protein
VVAAGVLDRVGAWTVVVDVDELPASARRFDGFCTTAFGTTLVVAVAAADLAAWVLPVATTATRAAVRAVAATAVQRVSRLTRRSPAARALRCRVCS